MLWGGVGQIGHMTYLNDHMTYLIDCSSDPNDMEMLARFDESINWAATGRFTEDDVEEAKISVFSGVSGVANLVFSYNSWSLFST